MLLVLSVNFLRPRISWSDLKAGQSVACVTASHSRAVGSPLKCYSSTHACMIYGMGREVIWRGESEMI